MIGHRNCPKCNSHNTTVQYTEFHMDMVERVRTCDDCATQWTVSYGNPVVREVQHYD